jgi:hypothetical protein
MKNPLPIPLLWKNPRRRNVLPMVICKDRGYYGSTSNRVLLLLLLLYALRDGWMDGLHQPQFGGSWRW